MIRQVIKIDEDKCTGCGICADACQEGAIGIVDGKAKLLRDDYCDGLNFLSKNSATRNIPSSTKRISFNDAEKISVWKSASISIDVPAEVISATTAGRRADKTV